MNQLTDPVRRHESSRNAANGPFADSSDGVLRAVSPSITWDRRPVFLVPTRCTLELGAFGLQDIPIESSKLEVRNSSLAGGGR